MIGAFIVLLCEPQLAVDSMASGFIRKIYDSDTMGIKENRRLFVVADLLSQYLPFCFQS